MSITLATTWYVRGELPRFVRLLPKLEEFYAHIVICLITGNDATIHEQFTEDRFSRDPKISLCVNNERRNGRFLAIKKALEAASDYIHYVDMDRLLHWVETKPDEWEQMVARIEKFDCIIFGRSDAALSTHPQALITTEKSSNRVVSHFLGKKMDVSAGSKSFSRAAASYLVKHGSPDNFIGSDAEWPILLKKAGFNLEYIPVEGLDWESADQFKPRAATTEEQKNAAQSYDSDPDHWLSRIDIADQIIKTALEVSLRKVESVSMTATESKDFDVRAVFDVDDYLYFYRELLTDERTDVEVSALVSLLEIDQPLKILDLACGFGRHTNRLAALGHSMTGIDLTPGFLEIARQDARERKVNVDYQQGDMRFIAYQDVFDRCLLVFTAFGYFSDEVNLQVLVNVRNALKSGGLMIFDTPNRDALQKDMKPCIVVEKEGNLMIDRLSFDSLSGRYYNQRIVIRDGVRKDKPYFIRLYNLSEINSLLAQAGLEMYHVYGSWDGKEFSSDSRRMVVIAHKP